MPCWAIAHVFGRDAMYWYRLEQGLGHQFSRHDRQDPRAITQDLVADEKHSWLKGERVYIATTAAHDCILGASLPRLPPSRLGESVWRFCQRSSGRGCRLCSETVNTDGRRAPQGAWKALFPQITVILCFPCVSSKSVIGPPKRWATRLLRSKAVWRRITPRANAFFPSVCGA